MNLYADPNDYENAASWYNDVYGDYGSLMNLKKKKGFNPFSKKNMNSYKKTLRKAGNTMKKVGKVGADVSNAVGAPPVVTSGFKGIQ